MSDHKSEPSIKKTITTNNKQGKKGKRKRIKQSPEELYKIESTDRYNKLHHACSKNMHREAKVVKSFECQKIVRAIKAANDSVNHQTKQDDGDDGETKEETKKTSKALKRVQTLQHKLDQTKKMDLEVLVQVGLKRLGVLNLDPHMHEEDSNNEGTEDSISADNPQNDKSQPQKSKTIPSPQSGDKFYQTLLESMLRHKRLSAAMDQLNEKVTEYRQWTMFRQSILRGNFDPEDNPPGNKRKKKKKQQQESAHTGNDTMVVAGGFNSRKRGLDLGGHEGASGLFIGSLSGMMPSEGYDDGVDGNDEDGEGGYYGHQEEKKKNRPGQRARKAKAMAIEARNAGKTWDSSLNWREKKERNENQRSTHAESRDGGHNYESKGNKGRRKGMDGGAKPKEAQHIATTGTTWKEEGNAHPSWAAAAAQKSQGIAKFKGTKITFD